MRISTPLFLSIIRELKNNQNILISASEDAVSLFASDRVKNLSKDIRTQVNINAAFLKELEETRKRELE